MILDDVPGLKLTINRPIETAEDKESLSKDDSIVSEIMDVLEGIEILDDEDTHMAEVLKNSYVDNEEPDDGFVCILYPSSISCDEIVCEGEHLPSSTEYEEDLKKLVEELQGKF